MADPQTEDGYTRIANELLEAILRFPFSKRELNIVLAVIRKTYGFNKKADDMTLTQLANLTTLDLAAVSRSAASLYAKNVLSKRQGEHGYLIGINKKYNEWVYCQNDNIVKTTIVACQNDNNHLSKRQTQKTTPKDNPKRHTRIENFSAFWSAYPKKKSKGQAERAWAKINPDEQLLAEILTALERAKTSGDWCEAGGRFVPYPATWLNARGWEDEFDEPSKPVRDYL